MTYAPLLLRNFSAGVTKSSLKNGKPGTQPPPSGSSARPSVHAPRKADGRTNIVRHSLRLLRLRSYLPGGEISSKFGRH